MDYPQKKFLSLFLVGSTLMFGPASLDGKSTTKQPISVDQKVSMSEGQLSVFLKNDSKTFSEILHEARGSKGQKLMEPNFFRKILVLGKKSKISSITGIFGFYQKLNPLCFFFCSKMVQESVPCDSPKSICLEKI